MAEKQEDEDLCRGYLFAYEEQSWSKRYYAVSPRRQMLLELASATEISRKFALGSSSKVVICSIEKRADDARRVGAPHEFLFKVVVGGHDDLLFCATTAPNMLEWMKALNGATSGVFQAKSLVDIPPLDGFLFKTNSAASKWDKRWFILDFTKKTLVYGKSAAKATDTVNLRKFWLLADPDEFRLASLSKKKRPSPHIFMLVGLRRTFNLCAASDSDAARWRAALATVCRSLRVQHAESYRPLPASASSSPAAAADDGTAGAGEGESGGGVVFQGLEGQLFKTASKNKKKWDARWFVLDPVHLTLSYYPNQRSSRHKPKGSVQLSTENTRVSVPNFPLPRAPTSFCLQLVMNERTLGLAAPSAPQLQAWCAVLSCALQQTNPMATAAADAAAATAAAAKGVDSASAQQQQESKDSAVPIRIPRSSAESVSDSQLPPPRESDASSAGSVAAAAASSLASSSRGYSHSAASLSDSAASDAHTAVSAATGGGRGRSYDTDAASGSAPRPRQEGKGDMPREIKSQEQHLTGSGSGARSSAPPHYAPDENGGAVGRGPGAAEIADKCPTLSSQEESTGSEEEEGDSGSDSHESRSGWASDPGWEEYYREVSDDAAESGGNSSSQDDKGDSSESSEGDLALPMAGGGSAAADAANESLLVQPAMAPPSSASKDVEQTATCCVVM